MDQSKRKIMWVASFPKSGNTWTRAFLANYLINRPPGVTLPLGELQKMTLGDSGYKPISRHSTRPLEELAPKELYEARLRFLQEVASAPTPTFVKSHMPIADMFGVPMIPTELTRCAIYIVRNPLDVVISYSHHMNVDLERAAKGLANPNNTLGMKSNLQIRQFLGNWSMHVRSWQAAKDFPVVYMRYEEMLDDPVRSFGRMLEGVGAPVDQARLRDAVEVTNIRQLQKREEIDGFNERQGRETPFFRQGTKGQWREILPPHLIDKIKNDHGEVMRELGYL